MKQKTIVLAGMPGIEWAAENLTGHGGVEVDGNWYYTWDQAMAAAAEVGNGWRLPTQAELQQLGKLVQEWDMSRRGRIFGRILFLPDVASIYGPINQFDRTLHGGYWGMRFKNYPSNIPFACYLDILSSKTCKADLIGIEWNKFSVRLARTIK